MPFRAILPRQDPEGLQPRGDRIVATEADRVAVHPSQPHGPLLQMLGAVDIRPRRGIGRLHPLCHRQQPLSTQQAMSYQRHSDSDTRRLSSLFCTANTGQAPTASDFRYDHNKSCTQRCQAYRLDIIDGDRAPEAVAA